jgi:CRISPR-associated protein Csm3
MPEYKTLLGKIVVMGVIECKTGLHIGASKENMEIGAIDSPVVRDPVTREPYIPGSSLKGKMRALLEKGLSSDNEKVLLQKRNIGTQRNPIEIHICNNGEDAATCPVCRLFGSTGKGEGGNFPARLIVRDAYLTEKSVDRLSEIDTGLQFTEWKFENAIDRVTSAANPRQLERVPRGAEFDFELIYNIEDKGHVNLDLSNVRLAISLIEADALGGHGSRGYGQVRFNVKGIEAKSIEYFKGVKSDSTYRHVSSFDELSSLEKIYKGD